jgi:murein DD-endopeptidase MepM/ murein hydrolase activator NlpD
MMQTYVFQSGDTMQKVASAYGISLATLNAANGVGPGDIISPGNTLIIPANSSTPGNIIYGDGSTDIGTSTPTALLQPTEASLIPADWFKPPKVYFVIGVAGILWLLFGKKPRGGGKNRRRHRQMSYMYRDR